MDRKEFQKRWRMGVIQPELFYVPCKNDGFTIYLEKIDEFGERMSNVELRLSRTSLTNLYDGKYAYGVSNKSSYAAPLQTSSCIKIKRVLEDGTYDYEYEPSDFEPISYETHNFLTSPITIENAEITKTTASYIQFKPLKQPMIISGLKEGGYRLEEVSVFDSEYYYDTDKSQLCFALNEYGNLVIVKGLTIPSYKYQSYGKDFYSELNLPNSVFEKFEDSTVQEISIIKDEWITNCSDNLCSFINYETLWNLNIYGHTANDIQNPPIITQQNGFSNNGDFILSSNRDVSNIEYNGLYATEAEIIVNKEEKQISAINLKQDKLKGLRFGKYIYKEVKPPIYLEGGYFPDSPSLYYHKLKSDIEFNLDKDTQKITDINNLIYYTPYSKSFNINIIHEPPEIKFVASWVPIPKGVTTSFLSYNYSLSTGSDSIKVHPTIYDKDDYGNKMIGIKIYKDGQYQGYFIFRFDTRIICPSTDITIESELKSIIVPHWELCKTTKSVHIVEDYWVGEPKHYGLSLETYIERELSKLSVYKSGYAIYYNTTETNTRITDITETTTEIHNSHVEIELKGDNGIFHSIPLNEMDSCIDYTGNTYYYLGDGLTKGSLATYLDFGTIYNATKGTYISSIQCEIEQ